MSGPPSGAAPFRPIGERLVHSGAVVDFFEVTFATPDDSTMTRDVVRHPGAVSIVPLRETPDGLAVVFIRQFRAALGRDLLEIPAGKRDVDGEDPSRTAARELVEECGLRAGRIEPLAEFYNSPGFCDEHSYVYAGLDLTAVAQTDPQSPEEAEIEIVDLPLRDCPAAIAAGELVDAKSIIGVLLALRAYG